MTELSVPSLRLLMKAKRRKLAKIKLYKNKKKAVTKQQQQQQQKEGLVEACKKWIFFI